MSNPARSSNPAKRAAAQKNNARPVPTFDHLRAKKPIRIPYWVPMDDGTAGNELAQARQALARAEMHQKPELIAAAKDLVDQAESALRAVSVRMLFQGVGRYEFEKLVAEHPPTEEQKAEMAKLGREAEYNHDAMAAPLVALACVEPRMTVDQVEELQHGVTEDPETGEPLDIEDERYVAPWNQAEFAGIFQAALRACTSRRDADLGF